MDITLHHIISTAFVGIPLIIGEDTSSMSATIFYGEATNPLLTINEIMDYQMVGEHYVIITQIIFLLGFIYCRVGPGTQFMFQIQKHDCNLFYKFFASSLWILSMDWVWMMVNKAAKLGSEVFLIDFLLFRVFLIISR